MAGHVAALLQSVMLTATTYVRPARYLSQADQQAVKSRFRQLDWLCKIVAYQHKTFAGPPSA